MYYVADSQHNVRCYKLWPIFVSSCTSGINHPWKPIERQPVTWDITIWSNFLKTWFILVFKNLKLCIYSRKNKLKNTYLIYGYAFGYVKGCMPTNIYFCPILLENIGINIEQDKYFLYVIMSELKSMGMFRNILFYPNSLKKYKSDIFFYVLPNECYQVLRKEKNHLFKYHMFLFVACKCEFSIQLIFF